MLDWSSTLAILFLFRCVPRRFLVTAPNVFRVDASKSAAVTAVASVTAVAIVTVNSMNLDVSSHSVFPAASTSSPIREMAKAMALMWRYSSFDSRFSSARCLKRIMNAQLFAVSLEITT